jgi:hypothetical protein
MFVRFQFRPRRTPAFNVGRFARTHYSDTSAAQDMHMAANLLEGTRFDDGYRQRHLAYLGGITLSGMQLVARRVFFWESVQDRLDQLGITDEREKIEAAIAARVPKPTPEERAQCIARRDALLAPPKQKRISPLCERRASRTSNPSPAAMARAMARIRMRMVELGSGPPGCAALALNASRKVQQSNPA